MKELFKIVNPDPGNCQQKHLLKFSIKQAVQDELWLHPKSTLIDLYKFFFQGAYGPGHIIQNPAIACRYLKKELQTCTQFNSVLWQPAGYQKKYLRVSLECLRNGTIAFAAFFDAFIKSANTGTNPTLSEWQQEWQSIIGIIAELALDLADYDNNRIYLERALSEGKIVAHHSKIYRETYHPHYRLITIEDFKRIFRTDR